MKMMTMAACGLVLAATASAELPVLTFVSPGPGLNAPMEPAVEPREKPTDPVDYGWEQLAYGWEYDEEGDFIYTDAETFAPAARYFVTLEGAEDALEYAEMDPTKDWALEIVTKYSGNYAPETPWYTKNYDTDTRMIMVRNDGGPDQWILRGGNAAGGWDALGTFTLTEDDWNTWLVHYKADGPAIDVYLNGDLIYADFQTGHGFYNINNVQIEGLRAEGGRMMYKSVKLGQVLGDAPECNPGDADNDGDVDDDDLSLLLANWGADADCAHGEFSGEPPVDDDDLSLLLANWTGATSAVPEPATLCLVGLAAMAMLRRRT